jgi:hypothetical protein
MTPPDDGFHPVFSNDTTCHSRVSFYPPHPTSDCEASATVAMQTKAWMTGFLFSSWIAHFVKALQSCGGISPTNRHLLILDGHNSHVTLDVVYKAKANGLDLLTLPSHTSHRLQPLDCSVFRPFKCAFCAYKDAWTL